MNKLTSVAEERFQSTKKAALVGAAVNLILAAVKTFIGIVAQSQSLVADGIHSLSDLMSDGLVYYASRHARHGPDRDHPYGHGRFETMATMALGMFLIMVAMGITWDAFVRMFAPEKLLKPDSIALYAAGFSILANEVLYQYTRRIGLRIKSDLLLANAWHHRSDAISSVVVLAGIAGTLAGLPYLDAVAAVGVGAMIAKIGWDLGWGAAQELVDVGLPANKVTTIRDTILSIGGVRDLHMLRTRSLGGQASVDVHVQVEPRLSVSEGHMISLMVEERLKKEIDEIEDVTVHIDPEDDATAILCNGLPLRAEALAKLDQYWQHIEGAELRDRVTLHYLNGKIDVEVFFTRKKTSSNEEGQRLEKALQEALIESHAFGKVQVFIG